MNNLDLRKTKELFARLFVLGVRNKMNLRAFTKDLERSQFAHIIEGRRYDDYLNRPLDSIFFDITKKGVDKDDSFGVYDDAYWCGYSYFELYQRTNQSFAYLFLKLPLPKMMDLYSIYHEMDFSSLLELYRKLDQEKTVLRLLCEEKGCSLTLLSSETGISKATLSKYNASDDALFKGSFQAIYRIASYFDVPLSLFHFPSERP